MRRAILLLAASLAVATSGCSSGGTPGTLTFYWNFVDARNQVAGDYTTRNTGCQDAGVDSIDITIGGTVSTQSCAQSNGSPGVTLFDFPQGSYAYTLDGFRGNEHVFTTSGTANARWNTDVVVDTTLAALSPQSFVVYYSVPNFTGTTQSQCVFDGRAVAGITYYLEDANGTLVTTTQITGGQQPIGCDPTTFGFTLPSLPLGNYTFRYLQAVDAQGLSIYEACNVPVFHGGFFANVPLSLPTGATCS
jgi:hypothetical protein